MKIKFPHFREINIECRNKIIVKFKQYGNSWVQWNPDLKWWKKRLNKEIKEIFLSTNPVERQREIVDAINILSMMYENNKKFVKFHYQDLAMGRHG